MRRSETTLTARSGGHRLRHLMHVYNGAELVDLLTTYESARIQLAIEGSIAALLEARISLRVRRNFETYAAIRRTHGDIHLNQAFDPREARFGQDDFWLLAENYKGEPIATYCLRRFLVEDFYALIRSQALWFSNRLHLVDPRFIVECAIPPFGGEVSQGGGLGVRDDYRGCSRHCFAEPAVRPRQRYDPKRSARWGKGRRPQRGVHGEADLWVRPGAPRRGRVVSSGNAGGDYIFVSFDES